MVKTLIFCLSLMLMALVAEAADPALVIYLPMDEGDGKTVADLSGKGNDGELMDGPDWVPGKFGTALEFDAGSRVHIPASDSLHGDIFKDDFTLIAWVNPTFTGDTWQHVWRSVDGADNTRATLFLNTGGFFSWRGPVGGTWGERCVTPGGMVNADEWTHVAVVGDRQNFKIYINGEEAGTAPFEEMDGDIADYYLGFDNRQWSEKFSGAIDEVYILTRAMTADEIKTATKGVMLNIISVRPAGKLAAAWGHLKRE